MPPRPSKIRKTLFNTQQPGHVSLPPTPQRGKRSYEFGPIVVVDLVALFPRYERVGFFNDSFGVDFSDSMFCPTKRPAFVVDLNVDSATVHSLARESQASVTLCKCLKTHPTSIQYRAYILK